MALLTNACQQQTVRNSPTRKDFAYRYALCLCCLSPRPELLNPHTLKPWPHNSVVVAAFAVTSCTLMLPLHDKDAVGARYGLAVSADSLNVLVSERAKNRIRLVKRPTAEAWLTAVVSTLNPVQSSGWVDGSISVAEVCFHLYCQRRCLC